MRLLAEAEVPGLLRPGDVVYVAGQHAWPRALIDGFDRDPECTGDVELVTTRVPGFDDPPPRVAGGRLTVFFRTPDLDAVEGRVRFVPFQYRRLWDHLAALEVDLALLRVTTPDRNGECSLGPGVDFAPAIMPRARRVVVQIDPAMPRVEGAPTLASSEIDAALEAATPSTVVEPRDDETARRIGARVAALIEDGDCLQTGVGALPDAVLSALRGRRALGCHSGMIGDGVLELIEHGALDGSRKSIDRGRVVSGFVLGTQRLYDWAARAPQLVLRPVAYTHDPRVLAGIERLVAINSAIEVDLCGQVNGEVVGGRQVSGTGGSVDFFRGAALSPGGRSIVALRASAAGGTVSRIVPRLGEGAVATATRTDVDAVVTEHGVAWLRAASVEERVERLIAIAAPQHRRELERAAAEPSLTATPAGSAPRHPAGA